MIKQTTEKQTIEKDVIVTSSLYCNKCGKEHKQMDSGFEYYYDDEYNEPHSFSCSFGYYSSYDEESWAFDLCQDCLVGIVKSFKYVPTGFMQDRERIPMEKDHQKTFEYWQKTGKWEELLNYTVEDLEKLRGSYLYGDDDYIDALVERVKNGELKY